MADDNQVDTQTQDSQQQAPASKTFTQDDVNRLLAAEKRKHNQTTQRALDELQALRTKAELTDAERRELDTRIESLQGELLTKEELAKKERDKLVKSYEDQLAARQASSEQWQARYTESTIQRSLVDAAVGGNAFSASQIVAILKPSTRLVEVLDEDGKPTGDYTAKVKFADVDKNGKQVTLDLTPAEAVKRMREMDDYLNLFKGEGASGIGLPSRPSSKPLDVEVLARDPVAYRAARRSGKLTF